MLSTYKNKNDEQLKYSSVDHHLEEKTVPVDFLSVGEASIPFSNVVQTLGVTLDAELSIEKHVSAVVRSCFFHIRYLVKSVHTSPTKLQAALLFV